MKSKILLVLLPISAAIFILTTAGHPKYTTLDNVLTVFIICFLFQITTFIYSISRMGVITTRFVQKKITLKEFRNEHVLLVGILLLAIISWIVMVASEGGTWVMGI